MYSLLQLHGIRAGGIRGDFQTFRNEPVELLSNIQSKAEENGHQPQHPPQQTLSHSSSATLTFMPHTFQQPQQPAPAARAYILTIPETQIPSRQVIQPAQQSKVASKGQQQQSRGKPTSFIDIDDQQVGPSARPLRFTLGSMKHFNPPSTTAIPPPQLQVKKANTTYQDFQAFSEIFSL